MADGYLIFKQFRSGAIAFGAGLGLIIYANSSLPPSIHQELMVMAGLIVGFLGFVVAMLAQMRLLIGRLVRFFDRKAPPPY